MPEIFGKPVSKQTLWIGAGATGLLGIALYRYRKQQQAAAAQAQQNAAAQAPGTGAGASDQIDPQTGFPYGSVEDASALTSMAGYNSPVSGLGYSNVPSYNYGVPSSGYPLSGGFTSNAQWSQAAEQYLVNQGADPNTVGNALGKYITGQPITDSAMTAIVNEAIAFEGYPPVSGPNGYPPSIQTGSPGSGGGSGTPPPEVTPKDTVTVPKVTGMTMANAFEVLRSEALNPEPGGVPSRYIVTGQTPSHGTVVPKHSTVRVSYRKA